MFVDLCRASPDVREQAAYVLFEAFRDRNIPAWPAIHDGRREVSECTEDKYKGSTAGEAADAYGARGCGGVPPRGAYVFYDCSGTLKGEYRNWGHVGLSLGDGRVIHAWDQVRIDHLLGIEKLLPGPGFERPQYIGWTPVARILRGMTMPNGTAD